MGENYSIQQGESLVTIAHKFGFLNYTTIYNHPQNVDFRKLRPNPNLIHPGDLLYIPDKEQKEVARATGQAHTFVVKRDVRRIEIKVLDIDGEALTQTPYKLFLDGELFSEKQTDGSGTLREVIPLKAREGTLEILHYSWPLNFDHLNPIKEARDDGISGIQGRLRNLGYKTGAVDGTLGPRTRAAIRDFQTDHLPDNVTGEPDNDTVNKLIELYGS
jgi:hypothetical protein